MKMKTFAEQNETYLIETEKFCHVEVGVSHQSEERRNSIGKRWDLFCFAFEIGVRCKCRQLERGLVGATMTSMRIVGKGVRTQNAEAIEEAQ